MRLIDADKLKDKIPEVSADIFENCGRCKLFDDVEIKHLIDAQPTIDAEPIEIRAAYEQEAYNKGYADGYVQCLMDFDKDAPTKHGRWDMSTGVAVCTACGQAPREFYIDNSEKWPFCPLCGAQMDAQEVE